MARESEKQLLKELDQAIVDLDKAKVNADVAKAIYDVELAKLAKATKEANTVAGAIAFLRGSSMAQVMEEHRTKEKPVA